MNILIFNCGSSSLSYKIFSGANAANLKIVAAGKAHRVGVKGTEAAFIEHRLAGELYRQVVAIPDHHQAATLVFDFIRKQQLSVDLIGHRFLHGGVIFQQTTRLDDEKIELLEQCLPLAPVHNPPMLTVIRASRAMMPATPQYIALDSAFHASLPDYAYTYALPQKFTEAYGFRKYGFHGLSYQDVTQKAADFLGKPLADLRIVACHLGTGGSSVAAIKDGRSVDTSMGYSPLPGLIMSTRCGDIDPILIFHLLEQHGYTAAEVNRILNHESGLLGVSGLSSDMRDLLRAIETDHHPQAQLAFNMYVHRLKQYIGSMAAVLGGLNTLIFTDDVGLRCPAVRAAACAEMQWGGISLDPDRNRQATGEAIARIGPDGAQVEVLVIPNDEEMVIVQEGLKLFQTNSSEP